VLCQHQAKHPDAAVVVAGDFNRANLKKVMPNFCQHITCATRGEITMDHCYKPFKRGYKAASLPPFGKLDNAAIFLLPEYKQREVVVAREVRRWSDQVDEDIRDPMIHVDWDVFQSSSSDVSEFMDSVMSFIAMLEDTIIPRVKVRSFPYLKPWVDGSIRVDLNTSTAAYKTSLVSGNMDDYGEQ